ncbi:uncharacterized protein LOC134842128 [Symsagittifera roscoffensis]|uniref:uncharacterized protein LOC134842128 n=1 Tax=Symsagittifera roscoffensis TaxID=84072 RepID=UPI00307B642E
MFLGNWLSDLLRSPLVYKYGGLYADLDVLFLKDLNSFVDTVPINAMYDKPKPKDCQLPEGTEKKPPGATKRQGSYQISSSQFHLSKGHRLAWLVMEMTHRIFDPIKGERNHIGPIILTDAVKKMYNLSLITNINAKDLTILPSYTITPTWNRREMMWTKQDKSESYWDELTRCSFVHHLFNTANENLKVTGNPKREIYSYYGPKICPIAFKDLTVF